MKIPVYEPEITNKEVEYVTQTIKDGWVGSKGPIVKKFENQFAQWNGNKRAITTSNGTTALHLALVTLGIGKGDEVLIPNLTFISTANAVSYTGARPIMVDIEEESLGIDPEKAAEKITKKSKAIIPVHLYGHPAQMDEILDLAEDKNLVIIEDAAEAIGAEYKSKKVGTLGDMGCFSFYGNKIITTGEGGMITSNDETLIEKAFILREHGMSKNRRYWHDLIGFNYRLTSLQAAFGLAQIEKIDSIIEKKRKNAQLYMKELNEVQDKIRFFSETKHVKSVYWMNSIILQTQDFDRDKIIQMLGDKGIDTRPFFYPLTSMPPYYSEDNFEISVKIGKNGINLPSSSVLKEEEIKFISQHLKQILRK